MLAGGDVVSRYVICLAHAVGAPGTAPVRVRGLITARSYEIKGPQSVTDVDPRDVPGLLSTGLFRRE
jgi:hypothetical protein